jgi:hypothetical protein
MSRRQVRALVTVVLLTGSFGAFTSPALSDSVRTTSGLGGFSISANSAPFKVLVDDPSNPLPRPTDSAIVEADPSYTEADLATGPAARGVASTLWPGNLLGEGVGTATANAVPGYPVKAEARYPDKPFTDQDQTGGNLERASAMGLDVLASAQAGAKSIPGSVDFGSISSVTSANVTTKDRAVGRGVSKVSDVNLLGVIKIGSVSTVVDSWSDGKKQGSSGTTVVSGLTVAGMGFIVDEKGARPVGVAGPGTGPLPSNALAALQAAGITISGVSQTGTSNAGGATRDAKGLRITVDTTLFRKAITDNTPAAVTSVFYTVFGGLPLPAQVATYRSFLYYSLSATPKITFILGAGQSTTVANLPLSFTPPIYPPLPGGGGLFPPTTSPGSGGSVTPPALGGGPVTGVPPTTTGPQVAPPGLVPTASSPTSGPFHGVSAFLLLGAGLLAGFGGWGLMRLQGLAMAGGLLGAGCALGAPSNLPDLRGATS